MIKLSELDLNVITWANFDKNISDTRIMLFISNRTNVKDRQLLLQLIFIQFYKIKIRWIWLYFYPKLLLLNYNLQTVVISQVAF